MTLYLGSQRLVALSQARLGGAETGFCHSDGAPGLLDAARWHRTVGEQAFRARLLRAGAVERHVRLRGV